MVTKVLAVVKCGCVGAPAVAADLPIRPEQASAYSDPNDDFAKLFSAPSGQTTQDWSAVTNLDPRVRLDETMTIWSPRTEWRQSAIKFMTAFIEAGHQVERDLEAKWGIPAKFNFIDFSSGGGFASAANFGIVRYGIALDIQEMFRSLPFFRAIYAHELGHYLSRIGCDGKSIFSYGYFDTLKDAKELKYLLNENGDLPSKYLEPIPYHLIPSQLLIVPDDWKSLSGNIGVFYEIQELIANKICHQLRGFNEAREYARRRIKTELGFEATEPWGSLHSYALASELDLPEYKDELFRRIDKHKDQWKGVVSTQQLIDIFIQFYRGVSLKNML